MKSERLEDAQWNAGIVYYLELWEGNPFFHKQGGME